MLSIRQEIRRGYRFVHVDLTLWKWTWTLKSKCLGAAFLPDVEVPDPHVGENVSPPPPPTNEQRGLVAELKEHPGYAVLEHYWKIQLRLIATQCAHSTTETIERNSGFFQGFSLAKRYPTQIMEYTENPEDRDFSQDEDMMGLFEFQRQFEKEMPDVY